VFSKGRTEEKEITMLHVMLEGTRNSSNLLRKNYGRSFFQKKRSFEMRKYRKIVIADAKDQLFKDLGMLKENHLRTSWCLGRGTGRISSGEEDMADFDSNGECLLLMKNRSMISTRSQVKKRIVLRAGGSKELAKKWVYRWNISISKHTRFLAGR